MAADLFGRGWVDRADGSLTLTAEGRTAHERLERAIGRVRRHVGRRAVAGGVRAHRAGAAPDGGNIERALGRVG